MKEVCILAILTILVVPCFKGTVWVLMDKGAESLSQSPVATVFVVINKYIYVQVGLSKIYIVIGRNFHLGPLVILNNALKMNRIIANLLQIYNIYNVYLGHVRTTLKWRRGMGEGLSSCCFHSENIYLSIYIDVLNYIRPASNHEYNNNF